MKNEGKAWTDPDGTTHVRIDLSAAAKEKMHQDRLALLDRAGNLVERAFADPEAPTEEGEAKREALAEMIAWER
jgi:hypothetical protein